MMKMKDFSCEELKALAVELPDEVNRYKMAGDFEGAAKAIDRWMDKPVGEAMKTRLLYETYILQKLPKEFPDTEEEVIRKFGKYFRIFPWRIFEGQKRKIWRNGSWWMEESITSTT